MLLASIPPQPSAWDVVEALVPAWADFAVMLLSRSGCLHVAAFAHIDPLQMTTLHEFQQHHVPSIDDPVSPVARVFRTRVPELLGPEELAVVEQHTTNDGTRAALRALGRRTSLLVPLIEDPSGAGAARGVLVTAMSSSGRRVDEDDLRMLAALAQGLVPRLRV